MQYGDLRIFEKYVNLRRKLRDLRRKLRDLRRKMTKKSS